MSIEEQFPQARRAFWLTVANGAAFISGRAFFNPETVLAGLALSLTGSELLATLLVAAGNIGWMWPQLIVGNRIEHRPRKMGVYIVTAFVRVSAMAAMAAAMFLWRGDAMTLYWMLFALFFLFSSGGGVVVIPFMDIVAKTVPPRWLPMLWAYRRLWGNLIGFGASFIVAYILSDALGLGYPRMYGLLFIIAAVLTVAAFFCFISIREPDGATAKKRVSFLTFLKRGPRILRKDADFRNLYILRVAWAVAAMSQAVYVPYAIRTFSAPAGVTGGMFTAVVVLTACVASVGWGRYIRKRSEIAAFRAAACIMVVSPLAGLTLIALQSSAPAWAAAAYVPFCAIMFMASTAGINGREIADATTMLTLPTAQQRPSYLAFMNTLTVPLHLAAVLAGLIAEHLAYGAAFGLSAVAAVVAFFLAGRLSGRRGIEAG